MTASPQTSRTTSSSARFWLDRPVLITGATGLLGSWLTKLLVKHGADVVCLVRDWVPKSELFRSGVNDHVRMIRGDVADQQLMERLLGEYEIRTVMHLAAQSIVNVAQRNPVSTFETNVAGTWRVLEACRRSPLIEQIVMSSSDKVYGPAKQLPYSEDTPLQAQTIHDVSKSCADMIARSFAQNYELPLVITRCGSLFGGGDLNWNRLIPGTTRSLLRNQRPVIRSNGRSKRDFFYVEDAAYVYKDIAELIAAHDTKDICGQSFNFSYERPLSVLQVVEGLKTMIRSELEPIIQDEAAHEIQEQHSSAGLAKSRLGWKPRFTMEEGLERTVKWYHNFLSERNTDGVSVNFHRHAPHFNVAARTA